MSKRLNDNGKAFDDFLMTGNSKLLNYSGEIIDSKLEDVRIDTPDFLVFPRDMTYYREWVSHEEMVKKLEDVEHMGNFVLQQL